MTWENWFLMRKAKLKNPPVLVSGARSNIFNPQVETKQGYISGLMIVLPEWLCFTISGPKETSVVSLTGDPKQVIRSDNLYLKLGRHVLGLQQPSLVRRFGFLSMLDFPYLLYLLLTAVLGFYSSFEATFLIIFSDFFLCILLLRSS